MRRRPEGVARLAEAAYSSAWYAAGCAVQLAVLAVAAGTLNITLRRWRSSRRQ